MPLTFAYIYQCNIRTNTQQQQTQQQKLLLLQQQKKMASFTNAIQCSTRNWTELNWIEKHNGMRFIVNMTSHVDNDTKWSLNDVIKLTTNPDPVARSHTHMEPCFFSKSQFCMAVEHTLDNAIHTEICIQIQPKPNIVLVVHHFGKNGNHKERETPTVYRLSTPRSFALRRWKKLDFRTCFIVYRTFLIQFDLHHGSRL